MDPIKDKDDIDNKVRTVSEIVGCGLEVARELLDSHDGEVNRVVDTFCGMSSTAHHASTGMADTVVDEHMVEDEEDVSSGISPVLKRKKTATKKEESCEEVEFKKKRDSLNNYLDEVRKAMSKDEVMMILEDCTNCSAPQILADKTVAILCCEECGVTTCRKCCKEAHGEKNCGEEEEGWFEKKTVLPSKKFDADNVLDQEYRIAEGQFLRMLGRRHKYEIKSIDIVKNEKLEKKFNEKKLEFKERGIDDKSLLIFHGTPQENIDSILKNNFNLKKVAHGRAYGRGVYFSEKPEVSMGYTRDMSSLILCVVLPGNNSKEIKKDDILGGIFNDDPNPKAGAWAIVVPDVDQILPKYVINFTEATKKQNASASGVLGGLGLPPNIVANLLGQGTSLLPGQPSLGTPVHATGIGATPPVQLGGNTGQPMQPGPSTTITLHGHQPHILQQIMQVLQAPSAAAGHGQGGDVQGEATKKEEKVTKSGDDGGSKDSALYCGKCDVWVANKEDLEDHKKGKDHLGKHGEEL